MTAMPDETVRAADHVPSGADESPRRKPWDRRLTALAAALSTGGTVGAQMAAFLISMGLLVGILVLLDYDAAVIVEALWDGSLGSPFAVSQSLSEAVPLVLTGTAVWLAYQTGLFNIGADGQLQMGGLVTLVVTIHLPFAGPGPTIVLALAMGCVAGALWGAIAGALRAYRGSNEVISTMMLNFIAFETVAELTSGALRSPTAEFTPKTSEVPVSEQIGLVVETAGVPWIIVVTIVAAVAVILVVRRTTLGLRLRAVGLNRNAARHAGMEVRRYQFLSFCASGALAGFAGGLVILGMRYYIAPGWAPAWGFLGIVIAFLAVRTPLLIPVWGIVLGMIGAAGPTLKGAASVPDSITTVMQALPLIVLFLLYALLRWTRGMIRRPPSMAVGTGR